MGTQKGAGFLERVHTCREGLPEHGKGMVRVL
jgi:hypothetical protein